MLVFPSEVVVAWDFLGISLVLHPQEIPWKTQATPPSDGKNNTFCLQSAPKTELETVSNKLVSA